MSTKTPRQVQLNMKEELTLKGTQSIEPLLGKSKVQLEPGRCSHAPRTGALGCSGLGSFCIVAPLLDQRYLPGTTFSSVPGQGFGALLEVKAGPDLPSTALVNGLWCSDCRVGRRHTEDLNPSAFPRGLCSSGLVPVQWLELSVGTPEVTRVCLWSAKAPSVPSWQNCGWNTLHNR